MSLPRITRLGKAHGATDTLSLDYEARFLRRKRLVSDGGRAFLLDLPEVVSLGPEHGIDLPDGTRIAVRAAPEALLAVKGDLTRLAWHIGNRHTPCQITPDALYIRHDHVLADMLRQLGAEVTQVTAPFTPEGGAYGHGRTMGHEHGHGHTHDHAHGASDD
ncbi:urease accessory protein UreE [Dinoroseobacter sp. PD6]|uniref:urease accessory protein UreE n=1 Tax=Dinoroseobacter sp. PD6 TaxID=3028384 RepID=UPI00237B1364|nr:urease accessory protein UreE [Dinoroseobacter sp. PD6]MDD9716388.1 urease accessory protein UreE [Dinoroseobacter sp. PD6]